ncbi:receptor for retinol uptake STRA6 [Aplysia californica]|uniref:Receptor for retinol uptake STRA6 n=1 Tax=Aplysia californica TaxID=6500 RepID=A0ABM1A1I6_APLCA|nr:receptor for retinol uptake STRA6 [Aplysia californica]
MQFCIILSHVYVLFVGGRRAPLVDPSSFLSLCCFCSFVVLYTQHYMTVIVSVFISVLKQVVFECVVYSNTFFEAVLLILENDLELVGEVRKVTDSELVKKTRDVLRISIIVFKVVRVVLLVSLGLAALLGVVSIISAFPSYRRNLLALHRGNYSKLADRSERSNSELLAGSMRFAGYQVGYIAWGFIIQTAIFFIFFLLIATVIVLFIFDISSWAVDMLYTLWPVPALALAVNFSQVVFAKLFFLDSFGESLALTNRRIFFIFTYFLFFYNIFMGVFSCLLRIGKSLVLGAYLLPRLDHGILPRTFQFMDPGFHAYIGFLHVENAHCHPVVLTFVRLLLMACPKHGRRKLRDGDIYDESGYSVQMVNFRGASDNSGGEAVKKRVMYRWHLLYTLLQNPQVRLMRKGYLQSLMRARDLGLHIPVSDQTLASDAADIRERTLSYLQGVPGPQSGDIDSCEDIDCHEGIRERTLNYLQVGVPGPQREDIDKEDIKSHQLVVSGAEITTDDRQAEDVGYGHSTVGNGSGDFSNGGGSGGDVVRVCGDNNGDVVVIDRDVCDNRGDREGGHDSCREGEGAIQRVLSSHSVGPSTRNSDPWLDGPP